ncbi:MAG: PAS domain-containing sensor histidine kinase [Xanthomonadales bacterium]|nr:PAS domain-containing sensor histidine kinase [Xanthomonadales bacterium]
MLLPTTGGAYACMMPIRLSPRLQDATELLDSLGTPLALCNDDGIVQWAGQALEELTGARRWVGLSLAEASDQPALAGLLQRVRDSQRPAVERALEITLGISEGRRFDLRLAPLPLADIEPLYLLELSPARALQPSPGAAFGRMIAHEVRNPLGAIRGAAQLLSRAPLDQGQQSLVELILEETQRIDALVEQLQSGQSPAERLPTNIHRVLEHVRQLALVEFGAGLRLQRDYDPSIPPLPLDYRKLVQALLNLLRNAAQAGATEVTLRSRIVHRQRLGSRVHRQALRLEVIDNGCGIPPELRGQLTEAGVSGRPDGSGLGLAVVEAIAREHDGELDFDSHPGCTRFALHLPLEADSDAG